jgi:hypothetical protein
MDHEEHDSCSSAERRGGARRSLRRFALALAAAAALVFAATSAAGTTAHGLVPPPSANAWAPGITVGYTETVADAQGHVLSTKHVDGIPAGRLFGNASILNSVIANATSVDPGSDLAAAVTNAVATRGTAACCSSSGQDTVSFELTKRTVLGFVAWRYHQVDHWCWSYPDITCLSIGSNFYDLDGQENVNYQDHGYGWYYSWSGAGDGGHYAERDGSVSNCILHYGCLSTSYPYVNMWLNGNGAWTANGGGN